MHIRFLLAACVALLAAPGAFAQDLSISATSEDASGEAGGRVSLSYTATLTGAEEIEDVSVGFYFSTDQTLSDDDALSEREEVDTESDESESDNQQIDVPNLSDGSYFILVVIDDLNQVTETDESNNTVAIPFTIGGGGGTGGGGAADLQITSIVSDASGAPGDEIEINYAVENAGGESAGESQIAYLSTNATFSSNDTFLTREDLDGVDANGSTDGDAEFTVPGNLAAGEYFLIAVADDRNAVSESSETNNTASTAFTITGGGDGGPNPGGVDLRVSGVTTAPASADAGSEIEVGYTVRNTGSAESGETQVGIYFSTDRNLSSNDVLATRTDALLADGALAAGAHEARLDASRLAPGVYVLRLEAAGTAVVQTVSVVR